MKISKSVRILLVEDSPSDVRLMRESLKESGMPVVMSVAKDGVDALEQLEIARGGTASLPDLILLDLNLPKKTGREVLNEIKSDPELRKIPVLVMTSSLNEDDIMAAYNLNANCYIRKPSSLPEYDRVIRSIEEFWFMTVTLPDPFHMPGNSGMDGMHMGISSRLQ